MLINHDTKYNGTVKYKKMFPPRSSTFIQHMHHLSRDLVRCSRAVANA